jgi:hypothetical protein
MDTGTGSDMDVDTDTDTGTDTGTGTGTGLVQFPMGERLYLYLSALARIRVGEIN